MWKPGQLITFNNRVYRIAKEEKKGTSCNKCDIIHLMDCVKLRCDVKIPYDCYLKEIKGK